MSPIAVSHEDEILVRVDEVVDVADRVKRFCFTPVDDGRYRPFPAATLIAPALHSSFRHGVVGRAQLGIVFPR